MGLALGLPEYFARPYDDNGDPVPYNRMDPRVYLHFGTAAGDDLGRVVLRLSARTHPLLSDNFRHLCAGNRTVRGLRLSFRRSPVHSVSTRDGVISAGDNVLHNGHGGHSAVQGLNFVDKAPTLPARRGSLCMLNQRHKSDRFDSHFFILTRDPEKLEDGVCFGAVEEGMDVLDKLVRSFGSPTGVPTEALVITDCDQF